MIVVAIAFAGVQAKADSLGTVDCSTLYTDDQVQPGQMCSVYPPNPVLIVFLILGFYWIQQVINNVVHVTTAGVVGSWWFASMGDPSYCSPAITSSLWRATTYSFGSICFGSLLLSIIQLLHTLVRSESRNRRCGVVGCILQCCLDCLQCFWGYINSWAFVYVRLYGYPYIDACKNVMNLFRHRGWNTIIADRLVFRVLLFCNLGVAILSGFGALLCDIALGPFIQGDTSTSHVISFFIAFFIGKCISSVALFVVESAVRTVIICFAENPGEFEEYHPDLSEIMKTGWAEAYPTIFTVTAGVLA